ncbi:MAG: threonine/serine exporter family protein, partial [Janthinobacterium lividum]
MPLQAIGRDTPRGPWRSRWRGRLVTAIAGEVSPAPDVVVEGEIPQSDLLDVLEALVRMAEALLSCGASAADVTALTLRAAHGSGLQHTQVDITFTAVIISTPGPQRLPLTAVRVVPVRATDYSRLSALYELAHEAGEGLPPGEVEARLERLLSHPRPYRRSVSALGAAGMAASVSVLLGGTWAVALGAAVTTAMLRLLLSAANRRGLPAFFQQVAGAALATAVALALLGWQPHLPDAIGRLSPSLLVGSGIVVLLAGLSLVGSAEDAISGFYVTAGARAFETLLLTTGLVLGIAGVLDLGQRAGLTLSLTFAEAETYHVAVQVIAGTCAAMTWAVSSY